jgi:hypothetical protein
MSDSEAVDDPSATVLHSSKEKLPTAAQVIEKIHRTKCGSPLFSTKRTRVVFIVHGAGPLFVVGKATSRSIFYRKRIARDNLAL